MMLYGWCARVPVFVLKQYVSLHLCVTVNVCLSAVGSGQAHFSSLIGESTAEALCVPVSNPWVCRPAAPALSPRLPVA